MKKISLVIATIGLFLGALFFSLSSDSHGRFHAFKQAKAAGLTYALVSFNCPGGGGKVLVCGPGGSPTCSPSGSCTPIP